MPRYFTLLCSLLVALLGPVLVIGLLFTAGCWNEVSYDIPSSKEPTNETEEPASHEESVEEPTNEPAIEAPDLTEAEPEPIAPPVETDRYATSEAPSEGPSEEPADKLLPWETASSVDENSPEAERLFGVTDEPLDEDEAPVVLEKIEEEGADDFESFLEEAYSDVIDTPTDTSEAEPPFEESVEPPTQEVVVEEVAVVPLPKVDAQPTTEPTMEEDSLDSLFDDIEEPEPTLPAIDPASSRYVEEPLPLLPKEPVFSEPVVSEPAEAPGPMVEPLPAVAVLSSNTRHMAWLLGGKLSLAQLAGAGGATSDEVTEWTEETRRLAQQLKVTAPPSADTQASAIERVRHLLGSAAAIGNSLAEVHGPDHAALVEMALKTNALLVLHEERPDLTPAVARAVAAAANRADLPGYVWRDSIKVLERRPTVDEVYDAVIQLHADVEAYLR